MVSQVSKQKPRRFAAIVLAAGAGRRFGGAKLTAPFGEGVVIDSALDLAAAAGTPVIVAIGADPQVAARARARLKDKAELIIVEVASWDLGLSKSLRAAVAAVPKACDGAFICLGDMPKIPHAIPSRLASAFEETDLAVAPFYQGLRGHPVLISRGLFSRLDALKGDQGAGRILDGLGPALRRVDTDHAGIGFDIDTQADLTPKSETSRP